MGNKRRSSASSPRCASTQTARGPPTASASSRRPRRAPSPRSPTPSSDKVGRKRGARDDAGSARLLRRPPPPARPSRPHSSGRFGWCRASSSRTRRGWRARSRARARQPCSCDCTPSASGRGASRAAARGSGVRWRSPGRARAPPDSVRSPCCARRAPRATRSRGCCARASAASPRQIRSHAATRRSRRDSNHRRSPSYTRQSCTKHLRCQNRPAGSACRGRAGSRT